jgi:hypothetical protein
MMHIIYSLPDFVAAALQYWISIMTGSIIAAALVLVEHFRRTPITWGWCVSQSRCLAYWCRQMAKYHRYMAP